MRQGKRILCLGSLIMDLSARCREIPKDGETVYTSEDYQVNPGGKGGNQAVAAARSGGRVTVLGRIAADEYGLCLRSHFKKDNIDTDYLIEDREAKSGTAFVWVDQKGRNRCLCCLGANGKLTVEDVKSYRPLFQEGGVVMTTLEFDQEILECVTAMAREGGCTLIVDPSARDYDKLTARIAERIDILKPNEVETEILTGISPDTESNVTRAIDKLKELGIKRPIISLGERGAAFEEDGSPVFLKAPSVRAVDTTAAGDTFLGSLAARLSLGEPFSRAAEYACQAAALCVQKKGAQVSIPFEKNVL